VDLLAACVDGATIIMSKQTYAIIKTKKNWRLMFIAITQVGEHKGVKNNVENSFHKCLLFGYTELKLSIYKSKNSS
jgi:hypothetical protein